MRTICGGTMVVRFGVAGLSLLFLAGVALALPCKEEPNVGDTLEEVSDNCRPATLKEHREGWEEISDGKITSRRTIVIDEWSFDAGPEQLMRTFVFENGKLAELRSAGYGKIRDPLQDTCRNGEALALGDTILDAYLKCGEPLAKEQRENKVTETHEGGRVRRSSVSVAEWTFRYGPDLPGYTVRFEDGVAADIGTREFGK